MNTFLRSRDGHVIRHWTWSCLVYLLLLGHISRALESGQYSGVPDEYDYDEEDENAPPDPLLRPKGTEAQAPYFEETHVEVLTSPGSDVVMNCDLKNIRASNVVVWYKNDTVYTNGQFAINRRVEGLKNNSMLIHNVRPEDAGQYVCEVLPEKLHLYTTLVVAQPRSLSIRCDGREVLDRTVTFRDGESHRCVCQVPGSQAATGSIKWFHNGRRAEEAQPTVQVDGDAITLDAIDEQSGGVFQCLHDDGSAQPQHGLFTVAVQYAPKVGTHRHYVNTERGHDAELSCDYRAQPLAVTRWLRHGQVLAHSPKYAISSAASEHGNRTVLTVRDVEPDDLGEYVCRAENVVGSRELRIHLIFEPERGLFEDIELAGNRVRLHWLVRSVQPLSEAILDYKMAGSYTWSTTSVLHTRRHEDGDVWKVTHEMELMPGEWHTRMKTRNTVGWSHFSAPYVFHIKDEEDAPGRGTGENGVLSDGQDEEESVLRAGMGGMQRHHSSAASATPTRLRAAALAVSAALVSCSRAL